MDPKALMNSLQHKLRRVTSKGKFIPEIDGLRFIAILPVVIQHSSERMIRNLDPAIADPYHDNIFAFWASRGTIGVFLFFALSGFILCLPFARMNLNQGKKVPLNKYFLRRVTRLEPPYLFWMGIFFIALLMQAGNSFSQLLPHFLASISYTHNLIYQAYTPINPVAWSLEIEIQFYILAPLLTALFFRIRSMQTRRIVLVSSLFAFILLQQWAGWTHGVYKLTILGQLHHFLLGFLLADLFLHEGQKPYKKQLIWDLIGIAAFFAMMYAWSEELYPRIFFTPALALLFIAAFKGKWINAFVSNGWISVFGGMCYTIYLIHLPLLELQVRLSKSLFVFSDYLPNLMVQLAIALPIIALVSIAGFLLIEKPCMNPNWYKNLRVGMGKTDKVRP